MEYPSKLIYLMGSSRRKLISLFLLFVVVAFLECFGIGSIGPFIYVSNKIDTFDLSSVPFHPIASLEGKMSNSTLLAIFGFLIMILFCVKSYIYWLAQRQIYRFSQTQRNELAIRFFASYMYAPYAFHMSRNSSQMVEFLVNDGSKYGASIVALLLYVVNLLTIVFIGLLMFLASPIALTVVTGVLLPLVVSTNLLKKRINSIGETQRDASQKTIQTANQGLGGIKEAKIIGCEKFFIDELSDQINRAGDANVDIESYRIAPRIAIETIIILFSVGVISIGILLGQNPSDLFPVFGILGTASIRLIPAISMLMNSAIILQSTKSTIDFIFSELKLMEKEDGDFTLPNATLKAPSPVFYPPQPRNEAAQKFLRSFGFDHVLELRNITYRYPGSDKDVIHDISLQITKGQSIGLIGKSGAGKSTLVDIILGLLAPQSGDITIDKRSIYSDLDSWQDLLGYIPQSIFLADDTIARNIAYGALEDQIDLDKLRYSIVAAQLEEFIESLPKKADTMVGERGVRLSGGQRQRIGIARALYFGREILVFDEATSALDNETEMLVTESIKSLRFNRTMIIIAHRLSTIRHCDCIYLLDNGRIVKKGKFEDVADHA